MHLADRHPHSLSEGQKRRVSIGQDFKGLGEMINILNLLHERTGNTMITITHDVRCAEALCGRAVHIENGFIAEEGGKELVRRFFSKMSGYGVDKRIIV